MVCFRGQKRLGHAQIGLLSGFNSKFPTNIPAPFIWKTPGINLSLIKGRKSFIL